MIRKLAELDLRGKTVFLRVDFNVPIKDGKVSEAHRIDSALPTIRFVLETAKKVVIASHLGRPEGKVVDKYSLAPVQRYLQDSLNIPVAMATDCVGPVVESLVRTGDHRVVLLENLRFHAEEEKNDEGFSRAMAALADVYVDDAFGAAHQLVRATAAYVTTRQQFGQSLAQFQAVKHQLANMALDVDPTRGLWWYAAHAFDHAPAEAVRAAALAKAHITERAQQVARDAVEAHGGIGFTWECDVQIWFKRAMFDRAFLGTPSVHRERAARLAGW